MTVSFYCNLIEKFGIVLSDTLGHYPRYISRLILISLVIDTVNLFRIKIATFCITLPQPEIFHLSESLTIKRPIK